jgi:uncharacterized protein YndB with AHSA1/START domain
VAAPIAVSIAVSASPEKIFEALTESAGLASFWVGTSEAEPVVGSITRLRLAASRALDLRVDELDPGRRVVWTPLSDIARPPSWTGTGVIWDLRRAENGATEVLVQHGRWPDEMPQVDLAQVTFLWSQVLRSLKAYAETGTAQPIIPAPAS